MQSIDVAELAHVTGGEQKDPEFLPRDESQKLWNMLPGTTTDTSRGRTLQSGTILACSKLGAEPQCVRIPPIVKP